MKFSGKIGFWEGDEEVQPGIWRQKIIERSYLGELIKNYRNWQSGDKQNADMTLNNQISILSDLYLRQNYHSIRYILWNGVKWEVTGVELNYPRLQLSIGGMYHDAEKKHPSKIT